MTDKLTPDQVEKLRKRFEAWNAEIFQGVGAPPLAFVLIREPNGQYKADPVQAAREGYLALATAMMGEDRIEIAARVAVCEATEEEWLVYHEATKQDARKDARATIKAALFGEGS